MVDWRDRAPSSPGSVVTGSVVTKLFTNIGPEVLEASRDQFADATLLQAEDIAETIAFVVTRPARVVMSELLVRPDGSRW